ncbi:MAG TPA: carboxypeptidase regulatory-like domain-containing protein [Gemmatimonadaceae bacterium]|nr:carboxypeptidase regulatory-like domain-containing protein [Gemmatimonadaceae bacterium]
MSSCRAVGILVLASSLTVASSGVSQTASSSSRTGAQISGVVYDSLARRPLAGADVQLQRIRGADIAKQEEIRATVTDESGAYTFESVEEGTYVLGFFHLTSDSLGVAMPTRQIAVRAAKPIRADLAVPSHAGLIALVCGRNAVSHTSALLMGFVRDAETLAPQESSVVVLQWDEILLGKGGVRGETKRITTQPGGDGWYAFCNVPVENVMHLRVARGADTSGLVAADLVGREVVRRDLYIGSSIRGRASVSGRVVSTDGRPLASARLSLEGSDVEATTNERGEFALTGLPSGSQTLNARALGFLPDRRTVHLLTGRAQNEVVISLTSLKVFRDTIRVTATRAYTSDANGFESRKRAGQGHYIDRAQIERQQVIFASDLLRMLPRVEVMQSAVGLFGHVVAFRKPFAFEGYCRPDLYVDGALFPSGDMEIDDMVNPAEIRGIEVYTKPSLAPAQFANNMSGCGSIVVWTQRTRIQDRKPK